jgi:hypothetical protein
MDSTGVVFKVRTGGGFYIQVGDEREYLIIGQDGDDGYVSQVLLGKCEVQELIKGLRLAIKELHGGLSDG